MQNGSHVQHQDDNSIDRKTALEFYWKYFELHSNQRMQMINFYITVEVVIFGALFTLITRKTRMPLAEYITASAITFMSIIFWGIDYRTKSLIHWCEDCIKKLEEEYIGKFGEELLIIRQTEIQTNGKYRSWFTYSKLLGLQFLVIGIIGIICLMLLISGKL